MPYKPKRTKQQLEDALNDADSIRAVLINLGLRAAGGNHKTIKRELEFYGLEFPVYDYSAFLSNYQRGRKIDRKLIFVENSLYSNRSNIKKMLIDEFGWDYKCNQPDCPNPDPIWNGKPLVLQLEHKNGIHNDNRF